MADRGSDHVRRRIDSLKKPTSWVDWATIAGALAGAAAVVVGVIALIVGGGGRESTAPSLANIEPVDLVVHDNKLGEPPPRLEILLHNTGGKLVVISRARIAIRRVGSVRQCVSQGDLPLSTTYAATLPAGAAPGDVVEVPLHQQLGADEADRFAITLGVRAKPGTSEYAIHGEPALAGAYLFELSISLVSDEGGRPLDVGRALVSLPFTPDAPAFYWTRASEPRLVQFDREVKAGGNAGFPWPSAAAKRCWFSNTKTLTSMLAASAERSPALAAVGATIVTPDMSLFETAGS
jgi:hypothetical protein